MPTIYLDHAAATYTDPRVLEAMLPYFSEIYGNAESHHQQGKASLIAIDQARETIAKILNCRENEIFFTGTATEANNLAIFGTIKANERAAQAKNKKTTHLVTSTIEHSSVRVPFEKLQEEGHEVTWLTVDKYGLVNSVELEKAIRPDTILVSIMYANNEIGTIEPIKEIGEICRKHKVLFHTDACQIAGTTNLDTQELNIDLLTINASKIYGPKGVGLLYIKKDTPIEPIIYGGTHERGIRAGTHNVPNIVGMAKALELVQQEKDTENTRLTKLRDKLIKAILEKVPDCNLNGHPTKRLPNNVNITFEGINAQELMLHLDEAGIYVSTGSACNVGTFKASPVLMAIGLPLKNVHSTIRMSLGKKTTETDIDYVIETLPKIIEKMRNN